MTHWIFLGLTLFLLPSAFLHADRGVELFLGPEVYGTTRTKEGGAKQTGTLYGVRLGYERVKRYKFYYALDGLYSEGILEGKNNDRLIRSRFIDSNIETRFGYTFQSKCFPYLAFTPFFGVGYLWEITKYLHPSPIKVQFENRFPYIPFGCLVSFYFRKDIQIGLRFTGRFLWDGKQKVKDPDYGTLTQCYEEYLQYRVELPIEYLFCWNNQELSVRLTPFYEYRHYGTGINFPFDFLDTKFKFYGANIELVYYF